MPDLPDYYTASQLTLLEVSSFEGGLDAAKPATPSAKDCYLATDTGILYVCLVAGAWTNIGVLYLLLAGGTMSGNIAMGGNKVTGLGAPTAASDAARKTETDLLTLLTTFNAHKTRHQNGGADEISVAALSGLLADDQHVLDAEVLAVAAALVHAARHEDTGADEISIAGLAGESVELAAHKLIKAANAILGHVIVEDGSDIDVDAAGKLTLGGHKTRHENTGDDEISVAALSGLLADDQHVLDTEVKAIKLDDFTAPDDNTDLDASAAKHGLMPKNDKVKIDTVTTNADVTADNAPKAHKASHENTGADEISVAALSGLLADDQHVLDAEAVSAAEAAGVALASGKNIKVISALTSDHTWSGVTATMTAYTGLYIGNACYVHSTGKLTLADKDAAATMPAIALATGTIAGDAEGEFLLLGYFRDDTWDWTPGGLLYIGDTGALTQDVSGYTTGDQVQVIGVAITADIIYFNPSLELVEVA